MAALWSTQIFLSRLQYIFNYVPSISLVTDVLSCLWIILSIIILIHKWGIKSWCSGILTSIISHKAIIVTYLIQLSPIPNKLIQVLSLSKTLVVSLTVILKCLILLFIGCVVLTICLRIIWNLICLPYFCHIHKHRHTSICLPASF